jgi:tetratricopeptide (TPR) repeat protein
LFSDRNRIRCGFFEKRRLKKAAQIFHEALKISIDNISSKWALGKIYQVLGDHHTSLKWFEEAWLLKNDNADICREASLAAVNCGEFEKALNFCNRSIEISPKDASLHYHRAIVLMFLERDVEAIENVAYSLKLCPTNQQTLNFRKILHSVVDGKVLRPKSIKDI